MPQAPSWASFCLASLDCLVYCHIISRGGGYGLALPPGWPPFLGVWARALLRLSADVLMTRLAHQAARRATGAAQQRRWAICLRDVAGALAEGGGGAGPMGRLKRD